MRRLRTQIDEPTARELLMRERWWSWRRWTARSPFARHASGVKTGRIELVALPHYLVTFDMLDSESSGSAAVLIGAHEPTAVLWDLSEAEWLDLPSETPFPPTVAPERAAELARRMILTSLRRIAPNARRMPTVADAAIELVEYPLWAYYYRRRARMLDVRLLDAVTARRAAAPARVALLAALAARRDARLAVSR